LNAADAICFRVFCITTVVLVVFPAHTNIAWPMILQTFCNATELVTTFYLVGETTAIMKMIVTILTPA
jgi:hypothetical protein